MSSLGSVNLLPHAHRPQRVERGGPAVILVGAMVCLLAMTVAYVVVSNQVGTREAAVADARQESAARLAKVQEVSTERARISDNSKELDAVRRVAAGRFAWERLMRELAVVTPTGAWLTEMSVDSESTEDAGSTLTLSGCSPDQPTVAEMMDGAKRLRGASTVQLVETSLTDTDSSDADCGAGQVRFEIQVGFGAPDQVSVEGGSE